MCPDKQLLSAYYDGEAPSSLGEKIDRHLEKCGACRDALSRLRALSEILQNAQPPEPDASVFARVRERVFASAARRVSLWNKRVRLPLAAAAALIFFGGGMAFTLFTRILPEAASVAETQLRRTEEAARAQNMDELLAILAQDDFSGELTIALPQQNFRAHGRPVILRAEDFPGEDR